MGGFWLAPRNLQLNPVVSESLVAEFFSNDEDWSCMGAVVRSVVAQSVPTRKVRQAKQARPFCSVMMAVPVVLLGKGFPRLQDIRGTSQRLIQIHHLDSSEVYEANVMRRHLPFSVRPTAVGLMRWIQPNPHPRPEH